MSTLNFPFIPKKEPRKRRPNHFIPLNLKPFFFLFLLSLLSMKILSQDSSQITLTIQGNSDQRLINDAFITKISKVLVNGNEENCKETCDKLGEGSNTVIIKFQGEITNCNDMFNGYEHITTVNLALFDASQVTEMKYMFQGCSNLVTITFGNMNTHSVYNMEYLFEKCSKLKTVDFHNLDISGVRKMDFVFAYCSELEEVAFKSTTLQLLSQYKVYFYFVSI